MAHPEEVLAGLGLSVPELAPPVAAHVPAARTGDLVPPAGHLPLRAGELLATGKVEVVTGTSAHGQGHETAFSQIIADIFTEGGGIAGVVQCIVY